MDRTRLVTVDPDRRWEPIDAPEARTLPEAESTEHGERGYEPLHPRGGLVDLLKKLAAPIVALGFLVLKFGGLLLKFKVVTTGASMMVSIAAYAWIWGLPFAVGFVILIFVHELGHVIELRRQGVPASAPLFIPFLGAVIGMKELPDDAWKEARVALAGPILGSVGAAVFWVAGEALGLRPPDCARVRRLLPEPLQPDPDRAARRRPRGRRATSGVLVRRAPDDGRDRRREPRTRSSSSSSILGGLDLWRRWRERGEAADYYRLPAWQRVTVGVVYLGLAAVLALAMSATYVERDF